MNPKGKWRKGGPKTTWRRTVEKELKGMNLTWGVVNNKCPGIAYVTLQI